jgi:hypothetical protein
MPWLRGSKVTIMMVAGAWTSTVLFTCATGNSSADYALLGLERREWGSTLSGSRNLTAVATCRCVPSKNATISKATITISTMLTIASTIFRIQAATQSSCEWRAGFATRKTLMMVEWSELPETLVKERGLETVVVALWWLGWYNQSKVCLMGEMIYHPALAYH